MIKGVTLQPKTRTQYVADAIRGKILRGEIKGGDPLRQDALAKEFDVSRIPVREALLTLESEGLLEFRAHKGAFATELSADKIRELFELRVLLECHMLAHAIPLMTDADLDAAEAILQEYEEILNTGSRVDHWSNYNFAFHKALYTPANRPETLQLITQLNTQSDRYIRIQLLHTAGVAKAESEHRELLTLCRERNIAAACDLLKRHIDVSAEDIIGLLSKQK
ncbi:GntR family transcriptional regulator [Photobacterium ganghwense]|uniref:GntR family transcriptional regulator n=1 Tax=Photobacterium ganghwense TaxID=320778 RepID=A0A0J1H9G7_9GAMM|nr:MULTISPECIES: GntR family transcriptional regulator [Photobacterium]KLV08345.1 GntR family transcriptional regulator [Photobacterium ganghwense]MBV1841076.1 GntR family transcriptional regulator [Photobacterium ganghwense]QSV16215.1 GntR family transcriptional regulator [Photobacterium ganghwense]